MAFLPGGIGEATIEIRGGPSDPINIVVGYNFIALDSEPNENAQNVYEAFAGGANICRGWWAPWWSPRSPFVRRRAESFGQANTLSPRPLAPRGCWRCLPTTPSSSEKSRQSRGATATVGCTSRR